MLSFECLHVQFTIYRMVTSNAMFHGTWCGGTLICSAAVQITATSTAAIAVEAEAQIRPWTFVGRSRLYKQLWLVENGL